MSAAGRGMDIKPKHSRHLVHKGLQKPRAAGISSAFNWHLCLEAFCNLSSLARALKKSVENRLRVGGQVSQARVRDPDP